MSDIAWAIEHSTEANAPSAFSWKYMTDVKNWDDPPAEFHLQGPFAAGSLGTTEIPGQVPRRWRLRDVNPSESYTIQIDIEGAVILCRWMFSELPDGRSRLTQHITLEGEKSASYKDDVERAFSAGLAPGMRRIADAIGE